MATFDDIARMRAALMAEKRQRMAQHPQQVAGAVGQAQSALAALAEQLQRQGIARDRITAANARAEADRKQRAAVAEAKAKAAAERAAAAEAGRNQRAAAALEQKNIASDLSPENRPGLIGGGALEGDLNELSGIGLTPDEAEAFARSQLGYEGGDFREMDDMNRERNEAADDRLRGQEMNAAKLAKTRADTDRSRALADKARRGPAPKSAESVERQRVKDELDRNRLELVKQQMAERRIPSKADRDTFDINIAAVNAANGARQVLGKVPTGYVAWRAGRIAAGMPGGGEFGRELRRLERDVGLIVQNAGKKAEGGKLADNDFNRYQRMFGNLDEFTPQQILDAVNDIDQQIRAEHQRQTSSVGKAKDVSEWSSLPPVRGGPVDKKTRQSLRGAIEQYIRENGSAPSKEWVRAKAEELSGG